MVRSENLLYDRTSSNEHFITFPCFTIDDPEWFDDLKVLQSSLYRYIIIGIFESRLEVDDIEDTISKGQPLSVLYRCYVEWNKQLTSNKAQRELGIIGPFNIKRRTITRFEAKDACMKSGKFVEHGRWVITGGTSKTALSMKDDLKAKAPIVLQRFCDNCKLRCQRILIRGLHKDSQCPKTALYDNCNSCRAHAKDKTKYVTASSKLKLTTANELHELNIKKKECQKAKALANQVMKDIKMNEKLHSKAEVKAVLTSSPVPVKNEQLIARQQSAAACRSTSAMFQLEAIKNKKTTLKQNLIESELKELHAAASDRKLSNKQQKRCNVLKRNLSILKDEELDEPTDESADEEPEWMDLSQSEQIKYYEKDVDVNINNKELRDTYIMLIWEMQDDVEFLKHFNTDVKNNMKCENLKERYDELSLNERSRLNLN
jgi:hypothetical protein